MDWEPLAIACVFSNDFFQRLGNFKPLFWEPKLTSYISILNMINDIEIVQFDFQGACFFQQSKWEYKQIHDRLYKFPVQSFFNPSNPCKNQRLTILDLEVGCIAAGFHEGAEAAQGHLAANARRVAEGHRFREGWENQWVSTEQGLGCQIKAISHIHMARG